MYLLASSFIIDAYRAARRRVGTCSYEIKKGDKACDQYVDIRIGKSLLPLVDKNTNGGDVNLGDFLPKVF